MVAGGTQSPGRRSADRRNRVLGRRRRPALEVSVSTKERAEEAQTLEKADAEEHRQE